MTMPQTAREIAPWVEKAARIGYVAKALLYATVGILAAQAALGRGGRTTISGAPSARSCMLRWRSPAAGDRSGARRLRDLANPGRDHRRGGEGGRRERARSPDRQCRAGTRARGLAVAAFGLATGSNDGGGGDKRELASKAVDVAGGSWLLWLAAAAVLGYACYQLYRAYAAKLGRQLDLGAVSAGVGWWVVGLSQAASPPGIVFGGRRAAGACGAARKSARGRRIHDSLGMLGGMGPGLSRSSRSA